MVYTVYLTNGMDGCTNQSHRKICCYFVYYAQSLSDTKDVIADVL